MKNILWPFIKHDKFEIIKEILEENNSVVVLDTNILFNLYRNTESDSKVFIEFIEKYKEHLVLPYTIGREFLKGRDHVLKKESIRNLDEKISKYTKCIEHLTIGLKELENLPDKFKEELDLNDLSKATEDTVKNIKRKRASIKSQLKKEQKKINTSDWIVDNIFEIFKGKVWAKLSSEEIKQIQIEGEIRYKSDIPPGFKDSDKTSNKFGDLFLWKEILKNCKNKKTLFVTDDTKDDWYHTDENGNLIPHPLLLEEYLEETNEKCYLVTFAKFMEIHKQIHKDESSIDNSNIESWTKTTGDFLDSKDTHTEGARFKDKESKNKEEYFTVLLDRLSGINFHNAISNNNTKLQELLRTPKWLDKQQKLQEELSKYYNNVLFTYLKDKDKNNDEDDFVSID